MLQVVPLHSLPRPLCHMALGLMLCLAFALPAGAYSIRTIPTSGATNQCFISRDGSTIVQAESDCLFFGRILEEKIYHDEAVYAGMNRDGSMLLAGNYTTDIPMLLEEGDTNWQSLESSLGTVDAVTAFSPNGRVIAGMVNGEPCTWQILQGGSWLTPADITSTALAYASDAQRSIPEAVSDYGLVVAGHTYANGYISYATVWISKGSKSSYTKLDKENSDVVKLNSDGTIGLLEASDGMYLWNTQTDVQTLLPAHPDVPAMAYIGGGLSEDGSIVVGDILSSTDFYNYPFIWSTSGGTRLLADDLTAKGVDLTGWIIQHVDDISGDGTIIVGRGTYGGENVVFAIDYTDGFEVTPARLDTAKLGESCTRTITAKGGWPKYTFNTTVASGLLPTGMSLRNDGILTGTPTELGSFTFTVSVTDAEGTVFTSDWLRLDVTETGTTAMPTIQPVLDLLLSESVPQ